jgi:hypothetical protein
LFVPYLVRLSLETLAKSARLRGSKMIPAPHALRASLALKLWSIERKSHVMALVADEDLALFAGLNAFPKKSYLSEYSSHITHAQNTALLGAYEHQIAGDELLPGRSFNLDFHSVPYYGEDPVIERHFVSMRSRRQSSILFMTLRRRSAALLKEVMLLPRSAWRTIELDVPARKFRTPRVFEQTITLAGASFRQLFIQDLGHDEPTILLTNDRRSSAPKLITRYAQRMLIENALSDAVRFFHMDALSSAVGLKVDFDMSLLVIASGLYRLLAKTMRGYADAQARMIFRDLIDTPATVVITQEQVQVRFYRRAHLPIVLASGLLNSPVTVPWWNDLSLVLTA